VHRVAGIRRVVRQAAGVRWEMGCGRRGAGGRCIRRLAVGDRHAVCWVMIGEVRRAVCRVAGVRQEMHRAVGTWGQVVHWDACSRGQAPLASGSLLHPEEPPTRPLLANPDSPPTRPPPPNAPLA
jgi:hypothetical protein